MATMIEPDSGCLNHCSESWVQDRNVYNCAHHHIVSQMLYHLRASRQPHLVPLQKSEKSPFGNRVKGHHLKM